MSAFDTIRLATKPTSELVYQFQPSTAGTLVVFVNGLGLPQVSWATAIQKLRELRGDGDVPNILTYDRFGQGQTTDRDPQDATAEDPMHGHDCMSAVADLHQLLAQITTDKMGKSLEAVPLVLVGNSIGCAIARLYTQTYPGRVAALLLLDSVLANSDFVSTFPDPDADGFDPKSLPADVTADLLRAARAVTMKIFHPSVGSKEGISRRNLAELLPASDGPLLEGPGGSRPYVTVIGHDFETFAEESTRMGYQKHLVNIYTNKVWDEYNKGLTKITDQDRAKGPIQAPKSGHFVQKDNPELVAQELNELLSKVM